jgi:hypothetical protein
LAGGEVLVEQRFGVEHSSEVTVAARPVGWEQTPKTARARRVEPLSERERLLAEVQRLELELERYRAHTRRTSKRFLSTSNFAKWVRESARRDAELVLRKARARAEKLVAVERKLVYAQRELSDMERERERTECELARLQTLTGETRSELSVYLTTALQVLSAEDDAEQADGSKLVLSDLEDTLRRELASASPPAPGQPDEDRGAGSRF